MSAVIQPASNDVSAMVLEAADRVLAGEVTRERLAAADCGEWPQAIWDALEEAGLPLALVPEAAGGVGLPLVQGMQIIRRAGYHSAPVPLAETMLAAWAWTAAGGDAPVGPATIAPAVPEDSVRIERSGAGHQLHGDARRVPWATHAGSAVVWAQSADDGPVLVLLDVAERPDRGGHEATVRNLASEPRPTLRFDGLPIPASRVRPAPPVCRTGFLHLGALMRAEQMVGAMERSLDHALTYAMERKQFGRPIAKFQAIQHMLAEAAGHFAAAAASADLAADAIGQPDFEFCAAVAKARVGEAAGKVAEVCHQVHGAMGFTQEHPLHFATRRLWSWRDEFGHEAFWQQRLGELVCGAGGDALWQRLAG
jgi:acyl-CoA dehydrogenase